MASGADSDFLGNDTSTVKVELDMIFTKEEYEEMQAL